MLARLRISLTRSRRTLVFAHLLEDLVDVRARGLRRGGSVRFHIHGFSFVAESPEANKVSKTMPTSGRADADAGAGVCAGGGVVASLIAVPSARRAGSP